MLANLVAGIVALAVALVFLSVLVYSVPSVALWIVVAAGFAMMAASFFESPRGGNSA